VSRRGWAIAAAIALGACAGPSRVVLSDAWPTRVDKYRSVTERWTRTAKLRTGYEESLDLAATFKAPEWRAAHVARDVRFGHMSDAAAQAAVARAQAALADHYEVELVVTTWDRRENDLDREHSVWRVVLVADDGTEIEPSRIDRDKRPLEILDADFPEVGDFAVAYVAQFPKKVDLLGAGVRTLRLRMSSARGGVELIWNAR
jgi:hypothetical protein